MDARTWELFLAMVGSGIFFSIVTWVVARIKKSGVDEMRYQAQCEEVKNVKEHQAEQDLAIRKLEKRVEDSNHNLDLRLSAMEIDITYIKQLQVSHNELLNATSQDIRDLLRASKGN